MDRLTDAKRATFYRQEAFACATAALTTSIAEIKQAYLELEQGWLCLTPKPENSSAGSGEPNTVSDGDPKPNEPSLCARQVSSEDNL
jgi:hypothetical protein